MRLAISVSPIKLRKVICGAILYTENHPAW